ncbi:MULTISPECIES: cellulose biosynthesis cyclic di-GMP-binding regulatory protein BcsB [unclassified Aureimonas]|uniref:cellulose biosynthesis cyclic di-GMP-binding regulatory protein BcsB n=1 Tax=unclassified Aureimonas TaxID=2615206 RepID=UPI000710C3D8|nr:MULTISPECIES: cellulose biosynthesis cyclic di-GMP-binding regulatory protein BcsB [unclassified Aureimonas]KQT64010.1 hypothetical protein ASG62_03050 [Aureimonas sp. Leaf427]
MTSGLRRTLAAATILGASLHALPSHAGPVSAFDPNAGSQAAPAAAKGAPDGLSRFALEQDQLSFQGENGRLDAPLFVTAAQSAMPARLVFNIDSAISVLPETSRMTVLVNDLPVTETRLGLTGRQTIEAELPSGLLQPGFNGVRILVEQHHRVDCSLPGTYELWTKIDPATSGLAFGAASNVLTGLDELGSIQPGPDGRIHVRGIVGKGATGPVIDQTMTAIQAATLLGYFDAPIVDVSNQPGEGAGLDVIVGTMGEVSGLVGNASGNTEFPFVTLLPASGGKRATLVVSGVTADDVRLNLAELAGKARATEPTGPLAGQQSLAMFQGKTMNSGETVRFEDLGVDARPFTGRLYRDEFRIVLPADFYAADYDYASIALDAAFSAGLKEDAQLIIRANDKVVTTLQLSSSKSGQLRQQKMRVPLNALKPGINVFRIEALVPSAMDAACEAPMQASPTVRFALAGTSSFTLPHIARVGHAPDISAMTAGIAEANRTIEKGLTVFVPNYDRQLLGAAATFVSKITSSTRKIQPVHTTSVMPLDIKDDLIAFGSSNALPPELFDTIRVARAENGTGVADAAAASPSFVSAASAAGLSPAAPSKGAMSEAEAMKAAMEAAAGTTAPTPEPQQEAALTSSVNRALDDLSMSFGWAASQIRDFSLAQTSPTLFTPSPDAALTIAQMPSPNQSASAWTMVTAPTPAGVVSGVESATSRQRWASLSGAVSEISGENGHVTSQEATSERLYETQPRSFSNARLVLAGWFSRHTEQYLAAMIGTLLLLGLATGLFLRGVGEKN